ncbi:MAG: methyltransferase domain-containing protein [Pyrinomonadaceae bacterium]|nr:methyltransferase domain-containing protein [Pyrinomonadaceae bacterium]
MTKQQFAYDSFSYSNDIFTQTHPDTLASIARFKGLESPDIENARILELGCGKGLNLISQAYGLPESEFVGIDLGKNHIDYANRSVEELGLTNVEFKQTDLMDVDAEDFGKFDYIIAHGLFSWVPDAVRKRTLSIYKEMLSDKGVGYLSYNVYPGWHYKKIASDVGKFHTRNEHRPEKKVEEAVEFITFLGENSEKKDVYKFCLQNEVFSLEKLTPISIFHDTLAEINEPLYFHEFVDLLRENELQFLSEAEFYRMSPSTLTDDARKFVEALDDELLKEQYMDFFTGTAFRQTLFCRESVKLKRETDPEVLNDLYIASPLAPESENPDLFGSKIEKFTTTTGANIQIDNPPAKVALNHLAEIWGDSILFSDLLAHTKTTLEENNYSSDDWDQEFVPIKSIFYQLICTSDIVEMHTVRRQIHTEITEKPKINRLAKWQLANCDLILAGYQRVIKIEDEILRHLLNNLDGTRTMDEIYRSSTKFIKSLDGIENKDLILENLKEVTDRHLEQFSRAGLLDA